MTESDDDDALALLQDIYRDSRLPLYQRLDAAKTAVKYERPALQAVAIGNTSLNGMADRLKAARTRVAPRPPEVAAGLLTYQGDANEGG